MGNRRLPQRRLRQQRLLRREAEDVVTRMALANPEIREEVEALAAGQSIEFKFDNTRTGFARRTRVLKVTRGSQVRWPRGARANSRKY